MELDPGQRVTGIHAACVFFFKFVYTVASFKQERKRSIDYSVQIEAVHDFCSQNHRMVKVGRDL